MNSTKSVLSNAGSGKSNNFVGEHPKLFCMAVAWCLSSVACSEVSCPLASFEATCSVSHTAASLLGLLSSKSFIVLYNGPFKLVLVPLSKFILSIVSMRFCVASDGVSTDVAMTETVSGLGWDT
jgi:hypothetical protein